MFFSLWYFDRAALSALTLDHLRLALLVATQPKRVKNLASVSRGMRLTCKSSSAPRTSVRSKDSYDFRVEEVFSSPSNEFTCARTSSRLFCTDDELLASSGQAKLETLCAVKENRSWDGPPSAGHSFPRGISSGGSSLRRLAFFGCARLGCGPNSELGFVLGEEPMGGCFACAGVFGSRNAASEALTAEDERKWNIVDCDVARICKAV